MSTFNSMTRFFLLLILSVAVVGCASGGGGNGGGPAFVRMDMGISTAQDLTQQTNDLFRRQSFPVFREDGVPAPVIESVWRNQTPTEDERALGVTEVQVRVIVRGRERPPNGSQRVFQVTYSMETLVKTVDSPEWTEMPVTPERRRLAREFGQELSTLLEMARR